MFSCYLFSHCGRLDNVRHIVSYLFFRKRIILTNNSSFLPILSIRRSISRCFVAQPNVKRDKTSKAANFQQRFKIDFQISFSTSFALLAHIEWFILSEKNHVLTFWYFVPSTFWYSRFCRPTHKTSNFKTLSSKTLTGQNIAKEKRRKKIIDRQRKCFVSMILFRNNK